MKYGYKVLLIEYLLPLHCVFRMSVQTSFVWSSRGTGPSCMSVEQELTIQSVPLSTADANLRLGLKTLTSDEVLFIYINLANMHSLIHMHNEWHSSTSFFFICTRFKLHPPYSGFTLWGFSSIVKPRYHVSASGKAGSTASPANSCRPQWAVRATLFSLSH